MINHEKNNIGLLTILKSLFCRWNECGGKNIFSFGYLYSPTLNQSKYYIIPTQENLSQAMRIIMYAHHPAAV